MNTFETFNNGKLITPAATKEFRNIPWSKHPTFPGVELKHLLTSEETGGAYSYHLVRIAPNCSIGEHIHETQLETHEVIAGNGTCISKGTAIPYGPGVISVFPAGITHEVNADEDGLYLFAKFMPALC